MFQIETATNILTALLSSGVLMLFIENQHISDSVHNKYVAIMNPFMHRLSSYFKYIKAAMSANTNFVDTRNIAYYKFIEHIDKFRRYAFETTLDRDFPVNYFSASKLQEICEDINNTWNFFDNHKVDLSSVLLNISEIDLCENNKFLNEVFPDNSYSELSLIEQIATVSEDFYVKVYQPIQQIPKYYEQWEDKDKKLKKLVIYDFILVAIALSMVLLFPNIEFGCLIIFLTICGLFLMAVAIYKMIKFESYSKKMFQ